MKTDAEIKTEIALLRSLRPQIPPTTMFGDDNLACIDAEIRTLSERYVTDEKLAEMFLPAGDDEDLPEQDFRNESAARDAMFWMLDEDTHPYPPSAGWFPLVKR